MGATVTTGRRAAAFRAPNGAPVYVLFEETYEKNVHPHRPSWSCIFIGHLADAIRAIFRYASGVEGGMLQLRGIRSTPENHLLAWFRELAKPIELADPVFSLGARHNNIYTTTNADEIDWYEKKGKEKLAKQTKLLLDIGRADIVKKVETGEEVMISLYHDIDLVLALYGGWGKGQRLISPWRLIAGHERGNDANRNPELGYKPKASKSPLQTYPTVYRLEAGVDQVAENSCFIKQEDGVLIESGWAYSVMEDFIGKLAEEEFIAPQTYAHRISTFRTMVEEAPRLPLECLKVVVDTTAVTEEWHTRNIKDFREKHKKTTATENGFEVMPTALNLYDCTRLPALATRWIYASTVPAAPSSAPDQSVDVPVQGSLFASVEA